MNAEDPPQRIERLFPFVLRARALLIGRETLTRSKSQLQFVPITFAPRILKNFSKSGAVKHCTTG